VSADWVDHRDVAAYALGLLGPRATADFEAHLSGCELCVAELAEFSRLAAVLPDVDVEALRTDAAGPDSRQLDRLLTRVAYTRRRAASVRLYAAAAAIVLFAGGLAGGLVIGSGHGSGSGTAPPRALPTVAGTSASGAPTVPAIRATDPLSRVQATLLLEPRR